MLEISTNCISNCNDTEKPLTVEEMYSKGCFLYWGLYSLNAQQLYIENINKM